MQESQVRSLQIQVNQAPFRIYLYVCMFNHFNEHKFEQVIKILKSNQKRKNEKEKEKEEEVESGGSQKKLHIYMVNERSTNSININ